MSWNLTSDGLNISVTVSLLYRYGGRKRECPSRILLWGPENVSVFGGGVGWMGGGGYGSSKWGGVVVNIDIFFGKIIFFQILQIEM